MITSETGSLYIILLLRFNLVPSCYALRITRGHLKIPWRPALTRNKVHSKVHNTAYRHVTQVFLGNKVKDLSPTILYVPLGSLQHLIQKAALLELSSCSKKNVKLMTSARDKMRVLYTSGKDMKTGWCLLSHFQNFENNIETASCYSVQFFLHKFVFLQCQDWSNSQCAILSL